MMERKHRAAAQIFREQNVMQQAQEEELYDEAMLQNKLNLPAAMPAPAQPARYKMPVAASEPLTSEELQLEKEPIRVRETGFWLWRRVVVPPNVYVVHTRIGRKEPVTIGLGLSFRYNPFTDAYLVVPAAMQTIGIVANGISKEKQGINILAYVQWQINDFAVAYRKLDFSDSRDPLGIVNAQLREQAEAAIKDKIATMSVEEILTDKEPIIEELTTRLKTVSEGRAQGGQTVNEGLGIKIVTVQIKEARVSSQRLWEHLQAPFRYEKEMAARISQLNMQDEVHRKELETRQIAETSEAETLAAIESIKQGKQTEALQVRLTEEGVRFIREQESAREKIQLEEQTTLTRRESEQRLDAQQLRAEQEAALEQARLAAEANIRRKTLEVEEQLARLNEETRLAASELQAKQEELQRQTALKTAESDFHLLTQTQTDQLEATKQEAILARQRQEKLALLELEEAANRVKLTLLERESEIARLQQEIRNLANERDLVSRVIAQLPDLAANMPDVHELRVLQTGGYDSLAAFLSQIKVIVESLGLAMPNGQVKSDE
jgi:regulator of protease activity HflC (stomatin/prohibitin superfamily)